MKCAFVCPYFGKFNNIQMILWLKTCKENPDFNWIIFTDDKTRYDYPSNVEVHYTTLEEIHKFIENRLGTKVALNKAYKFCDLKPLYGDIFSQYLSGYDYWGYCDISDEIYGSLSDFTNDDTVKGFDKVMYLGHMTLYRNNPEVNSRYKITTRSKVDYRDILASEDNFAFDEINDYSINTIYSENGYPIKNMDYMFDDLACQKYEFIPVHYDQNFIPKQDTYKPLIYQWRKGKLYQLAIKDGVIKMTEKGYIHYKRRKMNNLIGGGYTQLNSLDQFFIVPDGFIQYEGNDLTGFIIDHSRRKLIYPVAIKLKYQNFKKRVKRILS